MPTRVSTRGFTILEIVIALTILVVMVAVVVPSVTTRIRQANISSMNTTLDNLLSSVRNYKTNVTRYPQRLQQLAWIPTTNRAFDICGNNILGSAPKWRGPYVSVQIDTTIPGDPTTPRGLPVGDYIASDTLLRTPTTSTTPGRLDIQIRGVLITDWRSLNDAVDGQSGFIAPLSANGSDTSGTVQYNTASSTLFYGMPIAGC